MIGKIVIIAVGELGQIVHIYNRNAVRKSSDDFYDININKQKIGGNIMTLKTMTEHLSCRLLAGSMDQELSALVYDSRKIVPGCVFVCIRGASFDGHDCIGEAAEKQAAAVVVERKVSIPAGMTAVLVEDTRLALAELSAAWFGHPARQLRTIGITGTKGKTTTTYMIKSILESTGSKVGLIGTIEAVIGDEHIPAANTTPESCTGIFPQNGRGRLRYLCYGGIVAGTYDAPCRRLFV